jgi:hypothetical protein
LALAETSLADSFALMVFSAADLADRFPSMIFLATVLADGFPFVFSGTVLSRLCLA